MQRFRSITTTTRAEGSAIKGPHRRAVRSHQWRDDLGPEEGQTQSSHGSNSKQSGICGLTLL